MTRKDAIAFLKDAETANDLLETLDFIAQEVAPVVTDDTN